MACRPTKVCSWRRMLPVDCLCSVMSMDMAGCELKSLDQLRR